MPDSRTKRGPRPLDGQGLWQYALRALGGRAHSISELRQKLLRRAQTPASVPEVLSRLKELGYLDDRRFAENFAAARLESEGLGRLRVLRDLRQRRVAPALADQVVRNTYRDADEPALIAAFLSRKFRRVRLEEHLSDPRRLAAAYRQLRYAGFSAGGSIRALKGYSERAEDLESVEEGTATDT